MRTHLTITAVAALAALAGPAAALAAPGGMPTARTRVTADFHSCGYYPTGTVHLRSGPGTRYSSLGLLGPRDGVRADRRSGTWYRVSTDARSQSGLPADTVGWVHSAHLRAATCMRLD